MSPILVLAFIIVALAATTPLQKTTANNALSSLDNNSSAFVLPTNSSQSASRTLPDPPPFFDSELVVDIHKPLNPRDVYLVAVEAMYQFAQREWGEEVLDQATIFRPGSNVEIIVKNTQRALDFNQLEVSHVIIGLYRGVLQMVNHPDWFEGVITMTVEGYQVGTMTIQTMHAGVDMNSTTSTNATTGNFATARSLNARALVRGQYTDPHHHQFQLNWEFDSSPYGLMDQKTIFTAVLGGLADAAVHNPHKSVLQIIAISAGVGEGPPAYWCAFRIGINYRQIPMTYSLVTRTLRDVAGYLMVEQNRFGDMSLDVLYGGRNIAYALVSKMGPD